MDNESRDSEHSSKDVTVVISRKIKKNLIVIGGGKSRLKERLLGFTTSRIASQTKRPILVAK